MSWAHFWQLSTITFFGGMAIGAWLGLRRHRIPPAQTVADMTPPTTAELHAGVFTQSDDGDEPRPIQVGDKVTLYPIIGGYDAVRAMFDPHNPPRPPRTESPYKTGVCPECDQLVEIEWVDNTAPGGYVDRVPGRWICRTAGCKYGEPAATLQEAIDAGRSLAEVHEQLYGGQDASPQ